MHNGHFGPNPEFPVGIHHSALVYGEGAMGFPCFLLCYHGEAELAYRGGCSEFSDFCKTSGQALGRHLPAVMVVGGWSIEPNSARCRFNIFTACLGIDDHISLILHKSA
jgi:hypothetical protein